MTQRTGRQPGEKVMGWEQTRMYEQRVPRLRDRLCPDGKEIRAACLSVLVFGVLFILSGFLVSGSGISLWHGIELHGSIIFLAIFFEFLDSAAGMGYGTAMTPLLLLLGYDPIQIVPAIMIQQAAAGLTGAYLHNEFGNVHWGFRPFTETTRLWLIIAGAGCCAVVFSITSVYALLKVAKGPIKIYVTILLVGMAVVSLYQVRRQRAYRPGCMIFFGALAGFNKGIGGGGYGPVVTIGGLLSGVPVKTMMAITSLSEGTVCLVSVAVWMVLQQNGMVIDFGVLPSMLLGSAVAAVAAPYAVKIMHSGFWKWFVPLYSCVLALYAVLKLVGVV